MPRVLLIEDDLFSATVLADGLEALGWEVLRESSGAEGLARALRERPDVVVTDLAIPGVDGATLAATLRLAPGRRVPVVLMSARDGCEELAGTSGADRFLEKPVRAASLDVLLRELATKGEPALDAGPGAVRVPNADVFGADSVAPVVRGEIVPGWLPLQVVRFFDRRVTGVLEVFHGDARVKLFFHRGAPSASRSSVPGTELGRVLERLGVLSGEQVEIAVAEARRKRRPLGEELVAASLLERATAERALREQIVARLSELDALTTGHWVFTPCDPVGLAGFDVPAGVAYWRLGGEAPSPLPTRLAYARAEVPPWAWALVDPTGELAGIHALLVAGSSVSDCVAGGGPDAARLLQVLHRFGLVAFVDQPPTEAQRAAAMAMLDTAEIEAAVAARHRAWVDADHYTLFGLAPDASATEIHAASLAAIGAVNPEHLPPGVSTVTRERAQALFSRTLEASRVLLDPERRVLYDSMISRRRGWRTEALAPEDHAVLLAERARQAFRRGEYVTAASLFRSAIHLEGADADILAMLGRTRRLACPDDPTAGEAELRRATELDPDGEFPQYWLARLHFERGELDASRDILRHLLAHNPEFELAREAMRLFP